MKVCSCCNKIEVNMRKRVCQICKTPAIWRDATSEEEENHKAEVNRTWETYKSLIGDINDSAL